MGDWNISIRGTGVHHNKDLPADADRMAKEFVEKLIKAGHSIRSAEITSGPHTDILPPTPEAK